MAETAARMAKTMAASVAALACGALIAACSTGQGGSDDGGGWAKPPAGNKLAQVQPGMSAADVMNILGPPDATTKAATGKAWIPYYYGNAARREYYFYKGVGQVIFADGNVFGGAGGEVLGVHYDPGEDGLVN